MARTISLFTDGACSGNPGPGGWACILTDYQKVKEMCGREAPTTNNRMELTGVIEGLKSIKSREGNVKVYSDSVYVLRGASQWMFGWKKKGWKTADGSAVVNRDLWEQLDSILKAWDGKIEWHHLRGHSGIPANERCDVIAVAASQGEDIDLYSGSIENYSTDLTELPDDTSLPPMKSSNGPKAAPLAYLSNIGGLVVRHSNWGSCEARVKGRSNAKFKKVMTADEEANLLESWGVKPEQVKDE